MRISEEGKGTIAVLITGTLWGTIGAFVAEMAARGSSSALTSFLRLGFACLIMLGLTIVRYGPRSLLLDARTLLSCALLGLVSQGAYNVLYSMSILANGVSAASILLYSAPVSTAITARILFAESISRRKALALAINVLGCALTVTGARMSLAGLSAYGILTGLGAGFCYSTVAVFGKLASQRANAFVVSTWSYLFAALFLAILTRPSLAPLDAPLIGLGILYAIIPTSLAYVIYYSGIRKIRQVSKIPVLASVEPIVATLIGLSFYHEAIGTGQLAGIVLVLCSIMMMREREEPQGADAWPRP